MTHSQLSLAYDNLGFTSETVSLDPAIILINQSVVQVLNLRINGF